VSAPVTTQAAPEAFPSRTRSGRLVRVAPVTWPAAARSPEERSSGSVAGNLAVAQRFVDALGPGAADVVCLPEGFLYDGLSAEAVRDELAAGHAPLLARFRSWARRLDAWLFVPMLCRAADRTTTNTVVAFDRAGGVAGRYVKMHPWLTDPALTSFEHGVTPGERAEAIRADFGRIGVQTCFDVNWYTGWRQLRAQRCALVVYPSEYPGGFGLRVRAWQIRTPVVAAVLRGVSRVVDLTGEVLAAAPDRPAVVELNLNRCLVHLDHAAKRIQRLTAADPRISVRRLPHDNVVVLSAPPDGPPIERALAEAGIRPLDDYLRRAHAAIRHGTERGRP
jgi:beta-ureidopropionase